MTTWMRVTDILHRTVSSCDFGDIDDYPNDEAFWNNIITRKAADTGFGHLVDCIMHFGFDPNASIGWNNGEITEGHHRLVAAILLCLDEIPVSAWGGYSERHSISAHSDVFDPHPIELDEGIVPATYM